MEEEALWRTVAKTATPMHKNTKPAKIQTVARPKPKTPKLEFVPKPFQIGETAVPRMTIEPPATGRPVRMDRKTYSRMKRGKADPEARIDLHGMTAAAAQTALIGFILRAFADEKRLVLVITGKGRHADDGDPVPRRTGVLRQHLPEWLSSSPLNQIVLDWTSSHQRHGGSGAFYVYLRRRR